MTKRVIQTNYYDRIVPHSKGSHLIWPKSQFIEMFDRDRLEACKFFCLLDLVSRSSPSMQVTDSVASVLLSLDKEQEDPFLFENGSTSFNGEPSIF